MYTVKQVAALTGTAESTLRVWERRYGVVVPARSESGYRLYDEEQVAVLRAMTGLVDRGVPASLAAATVRDLGPAVLGHHEAGPGGPDLVAAAASLDPVLLQQVLEAAFAGRPFEDVVDAWLGPALTRLGEAWHDGVITIAQEHFASAGVNRLLAAAFDAAAPAASGPPVLVGLPQGGRHELMLLAFAVCLRRRGVEVVYLGADVPTAEWDAAAATLLPRAAVLGVHLEPDVAAAHDVVDRLARLRPPVAVLVGGARAGEVDGAVPLPGQVREAAVWLDGALRTGVA